MPKPTLALLRAEPRADAPLPVDLLAPGGLRARPQAERASKGAMSFLEAMPTDKDTSPAFATASGAPKTPGVARDVPIDWEALEDAFENNAPEVHSYLHLGTGDVLRVVDGVADPQMHSRIAGDQNYLRIDPVSSREQYRWMERYIPMVEDADLQGKLTQAIDGKGAFRRFKDVLMNYAPERERWFSFRSERLRIFMEAWLSAHALTPVARPVWAPETPHEGEAPPPREEAREVRRGRSAESLRKAVRDIADALGPRDLDTLVAFAEFLKARRAARSFAQHGDAPASDSQPHPEGDAGHPDDDAPASQERAGGEARPAIG